MVSCTFVVVLKHAIPMLDYSLIIITQNYHKLINILFGLGFFMMIFFMEFQEWDDRLKMADDKGTLVYIQNLDIRFGPADIEVSSSILSFWLS
jgi:hypothetical protein